MAFLGFRFLLFGLRPWTPHLSYQSSPANEFHPSWLAGKKIHSARTCTCSPFPPFIDRASHSPRQWCTERVRQSIYLCMDTRP